jgi:hypothetical protein
MNLRERVEHGTGRFPHELQRAPHVQRAVERFLGSIQAAKADADLSKRRERDAKAMRRAAVLLQFHAAFSERQGLVVPVLHQRDVRLVAADRGEDVARFHQKREPLRLRECRHGLVEAAFLRQGDAGERMHHREMASIANRVQRGRSLGQVVPDDPGVTDLPVAKAQLEVGESNGA